MCKINFKVDGFQPNIFTNNQIVSFKLSAIIKHQGKSLAGGHYYVHARRNHQWYTIDDVKGNNPISEKNLNKTD